jgi:trimethylamine--corrinoid protein Co-methyltransferase
MWLPNREILEAFHEAGAQVDFEAQTVLIPPQLVEACIEHVPPGFTWHARQPANTIVMDGTDTHFSAPDSAINIIDLEGRRRPGTARNGEDICRLCDALPQYAIASTGVTPHTMPPGVLEAWHTMTSYIQSSKPVMGTCRGEGTSHQTLRMAEVVADCCDLPDGQLPIVVGMKSASPLFNTPEQLAGMVVYLRRGLPMKITPQVQAGATGPATLAGALVQQTAEFLGHAAFSQLICPGVPLVYGCVSSVFDMKKMMLPYGAPEADLLGVATVQVARHYGIPARMTGGSSDANALGMQAGAEGLMSILLPLLAGASYVLHGGGELENTLGVSYEKTLIDDELIALARRFARGIEVTPETLGFDVVKAIGPRGHFLATDHTLEHFRTEQHMPQLMNRDKYDIWEAGGGKRAEERARDRVRDVLANHQPEPLPDEAVRELQAIYTFACRSVGFVP